MTDQPCRLVILISGSGSNLQSFIDKTQSGELPAKICAVFSNRPNAFGLERAKKAGIHAELIDHTLFAAREDFDKQLINHIDQHKPDLLILAGFMRILTTQFVQHYQGRLLNIHPSLLPKYPGLHTHQRAIDAGDSEAGATVHFVTQELDGGPPVIQASIAIEHNDDADTLAQRLLTVEHIIYPLAAQWFAQKRLHLNNDRAFLDDKELPPHGYQYKHDITSSFEKT